MRIRHKCIDERFRNALTGHDCQTARYAGFAGLRKGDLLKAAEAAKFEVFLTVDQGIEYQQNLTGQKITFSLYERSPAVCVTSCNLCPLALRRSKPFVRGTS